MNILLIRLKNTHTLHYNICTTISLAFLLLGTLLNNKSANAQEHILKLIADKVDYNNLTSIKDDYDNNNKKWIAYFHGAAPLYGLDLGLLVAFDLPDYLGVSVQPISYINN